LTDSAAGWLQIDILAWVVGSPPAGVFNHCIPSSVEELAESNLTATPVLKY